MLSDSTIADEILARAQKYKEQLKRQHRKATWQDYERFKHELINNGVYGKEQILANILGI